MNNIPQWQQLGYTDRQSYEIDQLADFVKNSPWSELYQRSDLFDKIIGRGSDWSVFDKIKLDRMSILGKLIKNIFKIPSYNYDYILNQFAVLPPAQLENFKLTLKTRYPGVEFKEPRNLDELQKQAQEVSNGLNNLQKIAFLEIAEEDFVEISVLKDCSTDKIKDLSERAKAMDDKLAQSIKNKQPLGREDMAELTNILRDSGRVYLQIQDLESEKNRHLIVDILERFLESLAIVRRAQKDRTVAKLNTVEGIVEVLERIQEEDVQRFLQATSSKAGPTATGTTPSTNPPTA